MFRKVLIPVDVADAADTSTLLQAAHTLTAPWDCELHVCTVIPNVGTAMVGSYFDETFEARSRAAAEEQLAKALDRSGLAAQSHVLTGKIYDRIIHHADELGVDLIVVGAHQPSTRDYLLGANAAKIARHARQSVMVIRADS